MIHSGSATPLTEEIAKAMSEAPTSKKDAVAAGSKLMIGNPCTKCGHKVRYTSNGACRYCSSANKRPYSGKVGVKSKRNQEKWMRFDAAIEKASLRLGADK